MKRNIILKASGIAIAAALSTLATTSMAQDYPSSTIDTPSTAAPSYEAQPASNMPSYLVPLEDRSWGNQPRTRFRADRQDRQLRGAQGPIRSDDAQYQGSRWDRTKSYMSQPVGNRGFLGFMGWREGNSDTP